MSRSIIVGCPGVLLLAFTYQVVFILTSFIVIDSWWLCYHVCGRVRGCGELLWLYYGRGGGGLDEHLVIVINITIGWLLNVCSGRLPGCANTMQWCAKSALASRWSVIHSFRLNMIVNFAHLHASTGLFGVCTNAWTLPCDYSYSVSNIWDDCLS